MVFIKIADVYKVRRKLKTVFSLRIQLRKFANPPDLFSREWLLVSFDDYVECSSGLYYQQEVFSSDSSLPAGLQLPYEHTIH